MLGLLYEKASASGEGVLNQFSAMSCNYNFFGVTDGSSCINHMAKQRLTSQLMQDFWERGDHPGPLAGGKNNNIGIDVGQGVRQFTWLRSLRLINNIDNKLRY